MNVVLLKKTSAFLFALTVAATACGPVTPSLDKEAIRSSKKKGLLSAQIDTAQSTDHTVTTENGFEELSTAIELAFYSHNSDRKKQIKNVSNSNELSKAQLKSFKEDLTLITKVSEHEHISLINFVFKADVLDVKEFYSTLKKEGLVSLERISDDELKVQFKISAMTQAQIEFFKKQTLHIEYFLVKK